MKYLIYTLLAILCSSGCSSIEEPTPAPPAFALPEFMDCGYQISTEIDDWSLIFEDNFNNDFETNWTAWRGGAFNNELQHYQASNLFVENDYLYIYGQKKSVTGRANPFDDTQKSFNYVSGRIESKKEFGPRSLNGLQNIRFSARIRLVDGPGLWPAWWSYNDPWPTRGEIDILEARGHTPHQFSSNFHFGSTANQLQTDPVFNSFDYTHSEKLSDCFHVYELEWSQDAFNILFDGEIIKTYDLATFQYVDDFFNKEHRLVLNLAIGGDFFSDLDVTQIPDESFLIVDWVRVYQK